MSCSCARWQSGADEKQIGAIDRSNRRTLNGEAFSMQTMELHVDFGFMALFNYA